MLRGMLPGGILLVMQLFRVMSIQGAFLNILIGVLLYPKSLPIDKYALLQPQLPLLRICVLTLWVSAHLFSL
jgi:hypothetical protein